MLELVIDNTVAMRHKPGDLVTFEWSEGNTRFQQSAFIQGRRIIRARRYYLLVDGAGEHHMCSDEDITYNYSAALRDAGEI